MTSDKKKLKVLLIEEDAIVRIVHKSFLEKLNYEVEIACNGTEALENVNDYFDLILMDMGLPDILGTEVVKEFRRRLSKEKAVPIIALTGYSSETSKRDFLAVGVDEVVIKPVFFEQLDQILIQHTKSN
jgi:CheY-like chemotaxis protein